MADFQTQYRHQVPNIPDLLELHSRSDIPPYHSPETLYYDDRTLVPEAIDRHVTWASAERARSPFTPPDSPPGRARTVSNHADRLSEPQVGFSAPVEDNASASRDSQLSNSVTLLSQSRSSQQLQSERLTGDLERMNPEQTNVPSGVPRLRSGSLERQSTVSSNSSLALSPITCDGCDRKITGMRHKCLECPDWNYCPDCFGDASTLHPKHQFEIVSREKAARRSEQNGDDKSSTVAPGLTKCSKCEGDIDPDDLPVHSL
jgi:hypothetical protein